MLVVTHTRYDTDSGYDLAIAVLDEAGQVVTDGDEADTNEIWGFIDEGFCIAEVDFNVTATGQETIEVYRAPA